MGFTEFSSANSMKTVVKTYRDKTSDRVSLTISLTNTKSGKSNSPIFKKKNSDTRDIDVNVYSIQQVLVDYYSINY